MASEKLKVGVYWGAGCGGCDIALLDIHEHILELAQAVEILFWPCAMDFKLTHVEAMPEGYLDIALFHGAIRNTENEHMAHLLRSRAKLLVAFGACAHLGGIPGLANLSAPQDILASTYLQNPSTPNPQAVTPQPSHPAPEAPLRLPVLLGSVRTLAQTVAVDYVIPGCPPNPSRIWEVLKAALSGALPPRGAVLGASDKAMCDGCPRKKTELTIHRFARRHLIIADPELCFWEQGLVCMGPATRDGCGHRCIGANMPCRGCYGPLPGVRDQGARILSAVASHVDANDPREVDEVLDELVDPVGTFYRFGLPASMLDSCARRRSVPGGGAR